MVSDNSTTDDVELFIKNNYPSIKYIKRSPPYKVWDHYRLAIKDASADYVVLFHDDDALLPGYCQTILEAYARHPNASAIGCNAFKVDEHGKELGLFHTRRSEKIITDEAWFLSQYIPSTELEKGIAPFPSYCYTYDALKAEHVNERDGGPCADVSFVGKKLCYGPIIWLATPLMQYTVHSQSGSSSLMPDDYRKLWRYMRARGVDTHDRKFAAWRLGIWHSWYLRINSNKYGLIVPNAWRESVVHRTLLIKHLVRPRLILARLLLGYVYYCAFKRTHFAYS